jgi:AcrR family transcriptional regulator
MKKISPPPVKRKGRPAAADSEDSKAKIITAARDLIRSVHPSHVTKADVARHAGVDAALVNYYFGDLDSVWLAVIAETTDSFARHMAGVTGSTAAERIAAYVNAWLDIFSQDPHFNDLMVRQVFYGSSDQAKMYMARALTRVRELEQVVLEGVQQGEFREIEPGYLFLSIVGLTEFFVTATPLVRGIFGERASMKRLTEEYRDFVSRLVLDGISHGTKQG